MSSEKQTKRPQFIPSKRFTLALLVSLALFIQYAQRLSLSIGIVCMIDKTHSNPVQKQNTSTMTVHKYGSQWLQEKQFSLSEFQQQILLGSYWLGSTIGLIPGSWLSMQIGAKRTFLFSLLLSSSASMMMGVIYFLNRGALIIAIFLRFLIGFGHGPLFPGTFKVWAVWATPIERNTLTSIGFCSSNLGTAVTMFFGGLLCRYVTSGWVYTFMCTGIFGFIWFPLWLWLVADSPQSHPTISEQERNYLCEQIGIDSKTDKKKSISFRSLPWRKILHSKAVIGLFLCQFFNLFGLFFFYTNVGKMLTEIHGVSSQNTGYILAGGFVLMPITCVSAGIIADHLVRSKKMTLTHVRKFFNSLASFIPAICMVILCFCDQSHQILGIIAVLGILASTAIAYGAGYLVNFADITPAYSSMIFAVASTISTVGALFSNFLAGLVLKQSTLKYWRILFITFAITYTIGGVIFLLYGSAIPRKWATFQLNQTKSAEEAQPLTTLPSSSDISKAEKTSNTEQSIFKPE